jgi:3-isopropylmalate/(R)-2-methylmalate dehydratase small subunit
MARTGLLDAPRHERIFHGNCFKNGMLPVTLDERIVQKLFDLGEATPGVRLAIDLREQSIQTPGGGVIAFDIEAERKRRLLNGLDDVT